MKIVRKGGGAVFEANIVPRCVHEYLDGGVSVRCVRKARKKHTHHKGWTALGNSFVEWITPSEVKID